MHKIACQELKELGMADAQAQAAASRFSVWSQIATNQDLSQLESRLIRWMVGIFLTFLALLGGLDCIVSEHLRPVGLGCRGAHWSGK